MFQSPHGDKFQHAGLTRLTQCRRFRPLTGINFNAGTLTPYIYTTPLPSPHGDKFQLDCSGAFVYAYKFPSPHGDKLQQDIIETIGYNLQFPSPHGDKFQLLQSVVGAILPFPSPHGDKFQREQGLYLIRPARFRPLTGINFNRKVPSRSR